MTTTMYCDAVPRTTAHHVVAVDPALNSIGVATMAAGRLTAAARLVPPKEWTKLPRGERHGALAEMIVGWWQSRANLCLSAIVYEYPQAYFHGGSDKVDKNDLIAIAAIGALAAGRVLTFSRELLEPTPAEWTGGLPKSKKGDPWKSPRGARLLSRLSPVELALVEKSHDAIDAACLALWAVGRWGQMRAHHT